MIKLISWNVNGLRACVGKGFVDFMQNSGADIICLQETKMRKEQAEFTLPSDYAFAFWNSADKKGYSGTAVFSKLEPRSCIYGMGVDAHDHEGRLITLDYGDFYLVNNYTPNSQHGLARLDYRMEWEDDFRAYVCKLQETKPVIICGDLNVAHKEIDIKNPKTNVKNAGFTPWEREKMTLLLDSGFVDTFRYFYPDKRDAYTWWSFMSNARARNIGWRIDYFLTSEALSDRLLDALILPDTTGSDHCPVGLVIR